MTARSASRSRQTEGEEELEIAALSDDERLQSQDPSEDFTFRQIGDGRLADVGEERELARRKDLR